MARSIVVAVVLSLLISSVPCFFLFRSMKTAQEALDLVERHQILLKTAITVAEKLEKENIALKQENGDNANYLLESQQKLCEVIDLQDEAIRELNADIKKTRLENIALRKRLRASTKQKGFFLPPSLPVLPNQSSYFD